MCNNCEHALSTDVMCVSRLDRRRFRDRHARLGPCGAGSPGRLVPVFGHIQRALVGAQPCGLSPSVHGAAGFRAAHLGLPPWRTRRRCRQTKVLCLAVSLSSSRSVIVTPWSRLSVMSCREAELALSCGQRSLGGNLLINKFQDIARSTDSRLEESARWCADVRFLGFRRGGAWPT